jgi:hypothetical protein
MGFWGIFQESNTWVISRLFVNIYRLKNVAISNAQIIADKPRAKAKHYDLSFR